MWRLIQDNKDAAEWKKKKKVYKILKWITIFLIIIPVFWICASTILLLGLLVSVHFSATFMFLFAAFVWVLFVCLFFLSCCNCSTFGLFLSYTNESDQQHTKSKLFYYSRHKFIQKKGDVLPFLPFFQKVMSHIVFIVITVYMLYNKNELSFYPLTDKKCSLYYWRVTALTYQSVLRKSEVK